MSLTVAVQMDPLGSINPASDSTLLLLKEGQRRGHRLYYYTPDTLSLKDGMPVAHAFPLTLHDDVSHFYTLGEVRTLPLAEVDVVLMRQDPPFNMVYISATYMLERLKGKTLVVNDPTAVRDNPEKLFPLQFPECIPPTLISANAGDIRAFHREQGEMVLKPLYGHGGRAVFHINKQGSNLEALLEWLLAQSKEPWIAQRFLANVDKGERRIVIVDGAVVGCYGRIPAKGEIRSDPRTGGKAVKAELTPRQREVAEKVGAACKEKGLIYIGLDMIDDMIMEINITSPGSVSRMRTVYGRGPEPEFWEAIERRL